MIRFTKNLAFLVLACLWGDASRTCHAQDLIYSLHQVAHMSNEVAAHQTPAAFQATVTYFRSYERTLFVQDGEDAIYVNADTSLPLVPGDRILIRGTTRDSFRPIVISSEIVLLRHAQPPPAPQADYGPLLHSRFDARYVTVRGRVAAANMTLSSGRQVTTLELLVDGGYIQVTIDSPEPSRIQGLLDADVEVTGVASGQFDSKMQQTGILVHAMSFNQLKVLDSAAVDAWSIPVTAMDRVLESAFVIDRSLRVRVQGVLTYYHQSKMAVLQDGNRSIRVFTAEQAPLHIGDHVEAIGIPFVDDNFLTLKLGHIRPAGGITHLSPKEVSWDQLATGKYAFDLVSINGTVVSQVREQAEDVYVISTGGNLFSATVRHPFHYEWNVLDPPPPMQLIRPGSRVRITGVAMLDDGNPFNGAMAFSILMRSAGDVTVLAQPPWLDVPHLLELAAGLAVLVLSAILWAAMLRLKVQRQKAALARRMEDEAARERRRSQILEDISSNRPLSEILEQITGFVSLCLSGAPCWLEMGSGDAIGNVGQAPMQVVRHEICPRSGPLSGALCVGLDPDAPARSEVVDALGRGAELATLAVDTHGLYSDLVHRSEFDLLTDLHNRFSLEKRLSALLESVHLNGGAFGLVYIDLDDFKSVNDRFGHHVGDLCLQQVADRMRRQLRPGDILARIGGDEFAALVPLVRSSADMDEIAQRLQRCFDEPLALERYCLRMCATIGVSVYPEDGATTDELLRAADARMYAGKRQRQVVLSIDGSCAED